MNYMRLYVGTLFVLTLFVLIPAGLGLSKQAVAQGNQPITVDYLAGEWKGTWYRGGGSGSLKVVFNNDLASFDVTDRGKKYRWDASVSIEGDTIVITSPSGRVDRYKFRQKKSREELKGPYKPSRGPKGSITLKRAIPPPARSEIRENVVLKPQPKTEWPAFQSGLRPNKSRSSVSAIFPDDVEIIVPSGDVPTNQVSFSGMWHGWMCARRTADTKLAVEKIAGGNATVVYVHASERSGRSRNTRIEASFIDGELVGTLPSGAVLTYALREDGNLNVKYSTGPGRWCTGILSKEDKQASR